jgi:sugar-specific transcriptional regulator TrmB
MPTEIGQQNNTALILSKLGLNDIEQKVYLFGISVPPLAVSTLSKQAGLTRSNAYNVIESLQTKGLCWNLRAAYGRRIMFAGPEKLLSLYQEKISVLKELEKDVEKLSILLKDSKYTGPITQPRVQYFQGTEGVKKLYTDSLTSKDKLVRTAVYEGIYDRFGKEYVSNYIKERYKRGIKNKILYAESLSAFDKIYEYDPTHNREVRVPPKSVNFDSMIMIYDSRVSIITMSNEIFGTLIDSVDFSNTMKGWFDTIWNISKDK